MANVYPPSPALSVCDSLADIEDLDAFLEAQGQLSHWPTPPAPMAIAKDVAVVESSAADYESEDLEDDDEADEELCRIAAAFTDLATGHPDSSLFDVDLVIKILLRAEVPPEVLALAYSILKFVASPSQQLQDDAPFPLPDLATTACLSLATTFLSDKSPNADFWAREVCGRTWTAHQIDMTVLRFVTLPGLHVLSLASRPSIDEALIELCEIANPSAADSSDDDKSEPAELEPAIHGLPMPPKLALADTARWVHGVVTPAETPVVERCSFLRLL